MGSEGIPRWTGFTIGFNIVQSYIKNHPDNRIDDLTNMNANEILAASKYKEKFKLE